MLPNDPVIKALAQPIHRNMYFRISLGKRMYEVLKNFSKNGRQISFKQVE